MVLTRSQTNLRDDRERALALLTEEEAIQEEARRREMPTNRTEPPTQASAARTPLSVALSAQQLWEFRQEPGTSQPRIEFRDLPVSPSMGASGWGEKIDEHLRVHQRRDTNLPGARTESGEPATRESQAPRAPRTALRPQAEVRFNEPVHKTPSVISQASSVTEARKREAEAQAAEKIFELRRRERLLEEEIIKKRLAADLQHIENEGSRAGDRAASISESVRRVDEWLQQGVSKNNINISVPTETHTPRRQPTATSEHSETPRSRSRSADRGKAIEKLADHLQNMWRPPPRQVFELPHFAGDPQEWFTFVSSFEQSTARYKFTDFENVSRLRTALKGEARACVQHMLASCTKPDLIMRMLKKNFGRTDLLIDRALEELKRLPPLGPSANELNTFAIKVMNVVSTLMDLDRKNYADNPLLIREITDRLSPHLRSRWCSYARENEHKGECEIAMIAAFLLDESDNELKFSHSRAPAKKPGATVFQYSGRTERANPNKTASGTRRTQASTSKIHTYITSRTDVCLCCGGSHKTTECRKLLALSVSDRWSWARDNRVCFKCMEQRHRREMCRAKGCSVDGCPHTHHRVLHDVTTKTRVPNPQVTSIAPDQNVAAIVTPPANRAMAQAHTSAYTHRTSDRSERVSEETEPQFTTTTSDMNVRNSSVLLKVIPIYIKGPLGEVATFAMADDGSTLSLIDEELANEIGADGSASNMTIQGLGSMVINRPSKSVTVSVRGRDGSAAHTMNLKTVRNLGLREQRFARKNIDRFPHLAGLDAACYSNAVPRVLIGADHWELTIPLETRIGQQNEPAAVRCKLGWTLYGKTPRFANNNANVVLHCYNDKERELNYQLKQYFDIDSIGIKPIDKVRPQDQRAVDIFNKTVRKIEGTRYEVGQLWREDEPTLPPSFAMAMSRLRGIERKMDRDPNFAAQYIEQVNNLLTKGYAEKVDEVPMSNKQFYLPHFGVTNPQKPGRVRLVYDAAQIVQKYCLNDFLLEGPDLLTSLLGILLRFREGAYAVMADLQEMFLQIRIREEDQAAQLFLWREMDRSNPPQVYKMKSMIFGAASSPFLAHSVRNKNAQDNAAEFPDAVYDIQNNHYMDDFVASYTSERKLVNTALQVDASHKLGGFVLRGWSSNSADLMKRIPVELHAKAPPQLGDRTQKVLGMYWNAESDQIGFNTSLLRVPAAVRELQRGPTKREALSAVMSVYDPLGLLSHYTITAKIQLQRIWALKLGWDEKLPDNEAEAFAQWLESMSSVTALRLPRQCIDVRKITRLQIHIFVDASAQAFAAAAYWRAETTDGDVQVGLAIAKAKVAPVRAISIPRLELQSALVGTRLLKTLQNEQRWKAEDVYIWTDSRTVLHWVRNDAKRYSTYVSHRLGEIAESTRPEQWRWVPTRLNPVDDATRGDPRKKIDGNDRWYVGPEFLRRPSHEWPKEPECVDPLEPAEIEQCHTIREIDPPLPRIERFSNYDRLIRATGRALQFIEMVKEKVRVPLQIRHLNAAEHLWLQWAQRRDFADELRALTKGERLTKRSRIFDLDPQIGGDGVMRMRGRIDAAPSFTLNKRPAILDGHNPFVKLIILRAHKRAHHVNNEKVVNDLRQEYWILRLRPAVRGVARACGLCALRRAAPKTPPLGDLPPARLEPFTRPFTNCAVDLFGPMMVAIGRRHEKRWVALFTCLTTRAVHLELVHSLSTSSAIMALRRMASRRGYPSTMWSDNGTNLRGADAELRAAYQDWLPALQDHGLLHKMSWKFITPGAPNQGGAWERMVRTIKAALSITLTSRTPKEEVLLTLLAEAEHTVNSRPLTHVSVDPNDEEALTPNHFLLGSSTGAPTTGPCDEADKRTWRAAQALADHFWTRWVREYLPLLAPRRSSAAGGRPIAVGDCVVIADPNLPRNVWPKGIVEAVHPGPDNHIRNVDVRTRGGVFRRTVNRLAVLPTTPEVAATQRPGGVWTTASNTPDTT